MLWDIDQTLIDLHGSGRDWYAQVLREVTGIAFEGMPPLYGRTELAITTEVLRLHGVEADDDTVRRMWAGLIQAAARSVPELPVRGKALPGAAAALEALGGCSVQSLVTGNLREVAWHKLAAFDMHPYLDFELGGYGSLSAHRPDLVAHAVELAQRAHAPFGAVVVIGDTPFDIEAALAHDARAIGVATGRYDEEALRDAGAHVVLTDLSDTPKVLEAVHS